MNFLDEIVDGHLQKQLAQSSSDWGEFLGARIDQLKQKLRPTIQRGADLALRGGATRDATLAYNQRLRSDPAFLQQKAEGVYKNVLPFVGGQAMLGSQASKVPLNMAEPATNEALFNATRILRKPTTITELVQNPQNLGEFNPFLHRTLGEPSIAALKQNLPIGRMLQSLVNRTPEALRQGRDTLGRFDVLR